jgi:signal transduction histidine kinase
MASLTERLTWLNPADKPASLTALRRRVHVLKRIVPLGLLALVVLYEVGLSQWISAGLGDSYHYLAEIVVYGVFGPVLAYLLLHFLDRWLEERETSELQAQLLSQAKLRNQISREISDDALQTLFAASVLLASLQDTLPEVSPETTSTLIKTEQAMDRAIRQLRDHLQS